MFGLLKPSSRGLVCSERKEFNRFYCGLCKGLDHHHGTVTRGLLSYDGVFVALLTDALVDETAVAKPDKCRCPLLPIVQRPTVAPDSIAMTYASSVQMLLFDQWAADGERSVVRRFSRPHADLAHARLDELGVSLRALDGFERVQADVERTNVGPEAAAAPTANALRLVFASIAKLGTGDAEILGELGAAIGRAIYWIDALEDLEADIKKRAFNPCILHGRRSEKRVNETARLLRADSERMPKLLDSLSIARHKSVLHDILAHELRARAERAIDGVHRTPMKRPSFVIAFALLIWAWLCAVPRVWAAGAKHLDAGHDASTDSSDAGALPPLPPYVPSAEPVPPEAAPKAKPPEVGEKKQKSDGGTPCANPCSSCKNPFAGCGDSIKGCCNAPSNCCNGCSDCCHGCTDCGNGCDGCCKGCGNCCK